MQAQKFLDILENLSGTFYTGVPDSLLSPLIDAIVERHGVSERHIVAANEGSAVGLAAGYYLASSRPAVVYMQNSGIGNAVNPICSLLHKKVYAIPVLFVIGWRGEPGINDEAQHTFQGEVTPAMLRCLEIPYVIVSKETGASDIVLACEEFGHHIKDGQSVAFLIRKDALVNDKKIKYSLDNVHELSREEALKTILTVADKSIEEVYVCTTGKLSREVFELRRQQGSGHSRDFPAVGSMGHSLMIAYGIALEKPEKRVFCLDGDGSVLMHMGNLAMVGANAPNNITHIVINNGAHETVGGLPAASSRLNLSEIAHAMGYIKTFRVFGSKELADALKSISGFNGPVFIEVMCSLSSRADLGRPAATPIQNKNNFMSFLSGMVE